MHPLKLCKPQHPRQPSLVPKITWQSILVALELLTNLKCEIISCEDSGFISFSVGWRSLISRLLGSYGEYWTRKPQIWNQEFPPSAFPKSIGPYSAHLSSDHFALVGCGKHRGWYYPVIWGILINHFSKIHGASHKFFSNVFSGYCGICENPNNSRCTLFSGILTINRWNHLTISGTPTHAPPDFEKPSDAALHAPLDDWSAHSGPSSRPSTEDWKWTAKLNLKITQSLWGFGEVWGIFPWYVGKNHWKTWSWIGFRNGIFTYIYRISI